MKMAVLLIASFLSLFSCARQVDRSKLESIISKDIQKSMPKYHTYTPILFSDIDSAMSSVNETPEYKNIYKDMITIDSTRIADSIAYVENLIYNSDKPINIKYKGDKTLLEERKRIQSQLNILEKKYKPHCIGMLIYHKYKCSTDFGDSIYVGKYIIDNNYNIVEKEIYSFEKR